MVRHSKTLLHILCERQRVFVLLSVKIFFMALHTKKPIVTRNIQLANLVVELMAEKLLWVS